MDTRVIELKKKHNFFKARASAQWVSRATHSPDIRAQRKKWKVITHFMNSKKPDCPYQFLPPNLTKSGEAVFFLKNPEIFQGRIPAPVLQLAFFLDTSAVLLLNLFFRLTSDVIFAIYACCGRSDVVAGLQHWILDAANRSVPNSLAHAKVCGVCAAE